MSRFVLVLSSVVFAFGLAEVLLRVAPLGPPFAPPTAPQAWREVAHRRSQIPGLAYELRPNVQGVSGGARHDAPDRARGISARCDVDANATPDLVLYELAKWV